VAELTRPIGDLSDIDETLVHRWVGRVVVVPPLTGSTEFELTLTG
jgi:hypothetical protein